MNNKLTGLDSSQIPRYTFDEENNATRVVIAGDFNIGEAIKENLKNLKIEAPIQSSNNIEQISIPVIVKELEIKEIEKPVIVKELEIKEVEKIVVVQQLEIKEVEKPIIVTEYKTVEVPVIVKEKEVQVIYMDKFNYKLLFIIQLLTLGLIVVSKFIK